MRGKRAAVAGGSLAMLLAVAAAGVFHLQILEHWHLRRLASTDPAVRLDAVSALERCGASRSLLPLVEAMGAEMTLRVPAASALEQAFVRASPRAQVAAIEGLLERGWKVGLASLRRMGPRSSLQGLDAFARGLRDVSPLVRRLAAVVLVDAWPHSRDALDDAFRQATPQALLAIWGGLLADRDGKISLSTAAEKAWTSIDAPAAERLREVPRWQSRGGATPEARAIALAFATICGASPPPGDMDLLGATFAEDPSPLVRRAALRLAGYLGDVPGNLDLTRILFEERDPEMQVEAIQAREVWSSGRHSPAGGLELWDGFEYTWTAWAPGGPNGPRAKAWSTEELAHLEILLRSAKDPRLRDAASLSLAYRLRELPPNEVPAAASLRVHEWGVFRDGAAAITPAEAAADLPSFVHRSEAPVLELWQKSFLQEAAGRALKPLLFFDSAEPVCLNVDVRFFEGRPWMFYPEATDYIITWSGSFRRTFVDGPELSPPWISRGRGAGAAELRRRFATVPWLAPGEQPVTPRKFGPDIGGIGLRWCGLRVGYPEALEGGLLPASEGSCWNAFREVPVTPVALRGNAERFLFYDGSVRLPSPVLAVWNNEGRTSLFLKARSQDAIPDPSSWAGLKGDVPRITDLPAVLVVRKPEGGEARGTVLERISPNDSPIEVPLEPLALGVEELRRRLQAALEKEGLTPAETQSLLSTWEKEFFQRVGLRLLTVVPLWLYDSVLPLDIRPRPGRLVRTGVIWKECDHLGTGVESLGMESSEARWRPGALELSRRDVEIVEWPLPEMQGRPFKIAPDGCLTRELGGGNIRALSAGGAHVLLSAGPAQAEEERRLCLADTAPGLIFELPVRDVARGTRVWTGGISADGRRIALGSGGPRVWHVQVLDLARRMVLEIDAGEPMPSRIAISSDGRRVAFTAGKAIRVVDLAESAAWDLPGGPSNDLLLSADGSRVLFSLQGKDEDLYLADLEARTLLNVSRSLGSDWMASASADCSRILFVTERDRDPEVYLADMGTRALRNLSRRPGEDLFPAISGDGRRAAFASDGQLRILDLGTDSLREVPGAKPAWRPQLSADGRRVAFDRQEDGVSHAFLIELAQLDG